MRNHSCKFHRCYLDAHVPLFCKWEFHAGTYKQTLVFIDQTDRIMETFDKPYVVEHFVVRFSAKSIELALNEILNSEPGILPSAFYQAAGRRQTRRTPSRGEKPSGSTLKCRLCYKADGHNRQTCAKHSKFPANRVPVRPMNVHIRSHGYPHHNQTLILFSSF